MYFSILGDLSGPSSGFSSALLSPFVLQEMYQHLITQVHGFWKTISGN